MSTIRPSRPARWSASPRRRPTPSARSLRSGRALSEWLTRAAAAGTARVRRKMAEAVDLAKLHGSRAVDQALAARGRGATLRRGRDRVDRRASTAGDAGGAGDRVPRRARSGDRVAAALDPELARVRDMSVKTPAPPALPEPVERLTRRLRMPYLRNAAPEVLATARAQRWDPAEVVRVLLAEEAAGRDQATTRMRRRAVRAARRQDLRCLGPGGLADPRRRPAGPANPRVAGPRRELVRLRPQRRRQVASGRGARAPRDRPRQDRRLAHPGIARRR